MPRLLWSLTHPDSDLNPIFVSFRSTSLHLPSCTYRLDLLIYPQVRPLLTFSFLLQSPLHPRFPSFSSSRNFAYASRSRCVSGSATAAAFHFFHNFSFLSYCFIHAFPAFPVLGTLHTLAGVDTSPGLPPPPPSTPSTIPLACCTPSAMLFAPVRHCPAPPRTPSTIKSWPWHCHEHRQRHWRFCLYSKQPRNQHVSIINSATHTLSYKPPPV